MIKMLMIGIREFITRCVTQTLCKEGEPFIHARTKRGRQDGSSTTCSAWRHERPRAGGSEEGCGRGLRGGDAEEFLFVCRWQGVSWTKGAPQGDHAARGAMLAHAPTRLLARESGAGQRPR
jgi:hypothetical protein